MAKSKIEWTESTWNPITGCTKHSEGCYNCYAERMAKRLKAMGNKRYENGFDLTVHEDMFNRPLKWKKSQMIFVNSMSDMFHEDLDVGDIKKIFEVMNEAKQHVFQVLTKRADRLAELASELKWTDNIWMGVTVENAKHTSRIDFLREVPVKIKFISFEPLLGDVGKINLKNIDWAVVGGESGPRSRPIEEEWVLNIKGQCEKHNTLFYFKQWGGVNKKKTGRLLQGKEYNAMPCVKFNI